MHKKLRNASRASASWRVEQNQCGLRDVLTPDFTGIRVNDDRLGDEVKTYLQSIGSKKIDMVKVTSGQRPVQHPVHSPPDQGHVWQTGQPAQRAYLIVEQTEAMHVIDVNSGGRKAGAKDQEENALQTNLECCKEIARILRLRDMGGIICIDFIDMAKREHNKELTTAMKEAMKGTRRSTTSLRPAALGCGNDAAARAPCGRHEDL